MLVIIRVVFVIIRFLSERLALIINYSLSTRFIIRAYSGEEGNKNMREESRKEYLEESTEPPEYRDEEIILRKLRDTEEGLQRRQQFYDMGIFGGIFREAKRQANLGDRGTAEKINTEIEEIMNFDKEENQTIVTRLRKLREAGEFGKLDLKVREEDAIPEMTPKDTVNELKDLAIKIESEKGLDTEIPRRFYNKIVKFIEEGDYKTAIPFLFETKNILSDEKRLKMLRVIGFAGETKLKEVKIGAEGLKEVEKKIKEPIIKEISKPITPEKKIEKAKKAFKESLEKEIEELKKEEGILEEKLRELRDEQNKLEEERSKALKWAKWSHPLATRKYEYWSVYTSKVKAPTKRIEEIDVRISKISDERNKIFDRIKVINQKIKK